jgi:hypothetical protein
MKRIVRFTEVRAKDLLKRAIGASGVIEKWLSALDDIFISASIRYCVDTVCVVQGFRLIYSCINKCIDLFFLGFSS